MLGKKNVWGNEDSAESRKGPCSQIHSPEQWERQPSFSQAPLAPRWEVWACTWIDKMPWPQAFMRPHVQRVCPEDGCTAPRGQGMEMKTPNKKWHSHPAPLCICNIAGLTKIRFLRLSSLNSNLLYLRWRKPHTGLWNLDKKVCQDQYFRLFLFCELEKRASEEQLWPQGTAHGEDAVKRDANGWWNHRLFPSPWTGDNLSLAVSSAWSSLWAPVVSTPRLVSSLECPHFPGANFSRCIFARWSQEWLCLVMPWTPSLLSRWTTSHPTRISQSCEQITLRDSRAAEE